MDVNLKKASALALALGGMTVAIPHTFALDPYAEPPTEDQVDELEGQFNAAVAKAIDIVQATYMIRGLIGRANEGRINDLLTARAEIDKTLGILNAIPQRKSRPNLAALAAKLAASKEDKSPSYGSKTGPTLDIQTAPVAQKIRMFRKGRVKIEDELAKLNYSTTIKLPDDVVALLTEFDLV